MKTMKKKLMVVGLEALVLVLLAATLGFGQAKVVVNEWQIPFLNCLTGPIASMGAMYQWSADRAASDINQAGGIAGKHVKVIGVDTANDPQKGTVEMARLVKDSLVALGPVPEPVIMAAMPIAVENEMMSITGTTSYEYASKFFPWTVSWFPPYPVRLPPLVTAWAKEFNDMKQVVQFVENYGPWPLMADAHVAGLKAANVKVLNNVEVPGDAVTFGPLIVKALDQKPDGIIFACNAQKIAKIIKELKSRGWTKMNHLLVFSSGDDAPLYTTGGDDINGVQVYNYINPDVDNPRWNVFKAAFMKDHNGMAPFSLSTNYYDALYMVKEAIEKTGVTGDPKKLKEERKKIADYCANVKNFHGVMFNWDMKDGVPTNKPLFIFEIRGGKKVLVLEVKPQIK
jgi:branched-chain amino acid transport system substrate-binding protein